MRRGQPDRAAHQPHRAVVAVCHRLVLRGGVAAHEELVALALELADEAAGASGAGDTRERGLALVLLWLKAEVDAGLERAGGRVEGAQPKVDLPAGHEVEERVACAEEEEQHAGSGRGQPLVGKGPLLLLDLLELCVDRGVLTLAAGEGLALLALEALAVDLRHLGELALRAPVEGEPLCLGHLRHLVVAHARQRLLQPRATRLGVVLERRLGGLELAHLAAAASSASTASSASSAVGL
mmetsp:Transcript_17879/g.58297  ORF Transcript_17879/g.58297 Transcript_17879/m.58297 type:complete len:239 (+) Transcript_17879:2344-3060(+)